jgi:hypothetical protein
VGVHLEEAGNEILARTVDDARFGGDADLRGRSNLGNPAISDHH